VPVLSVVTARLRSRSGLAGSATCGGPWGFAAPSPRPSPCPSGLRLGPPLLAEFPEGPVLLQGSFSGSQQKGGASVFTRWRAYRKAAFPEGPSHLPFCEATYKTATRPGATSRRASATPRPAPRDAARAGPADRAQPEPGSPRRSPAPSRSAPQSVSVRAGSQRAETSSRAPGRCRTGLIDFCLRLLGRAPIDQVWYLH
jgi:hypothetical protein